MMSATKAMEITLENITDFEKKAQEFIDSIISPKLNDAILASARDLRTNTNLVLNKNDCSDFTYINSKQVYFVRCLDKYIREQKFKDIKIEPTKDYINISFRW